jgi:hypothetical protein
MKLDGGEAIIHKARPHWMVFGWAILLALGLSPSLSCG